MTSGAIGPLRVYQHFDADIQDSGGDVFQVGTVFGGLALETRDNTELFGASVSPGFVADGTFIGGAADRFNNIVARITGAGQPVSPSITIQNLPAFQHPQLGPAFGPDDIVSVLAWEADPNAGATQIESFLDGRRLENTDFDSDGVPDVSDNCPAVFNPDQADSDGDTVGDVCDAGPGIIDTDGDSVPDSIDACPGTPPGTPVQPNGCPVIQPPDADGDSVPDAIDQCSGTPAGTPVQANGCPITPTTRPPDFDSDGVPDVSDNCPAVANRDQVDSDGDLAGNVCDSTPDPAPSIGNANNVRCNGRRCDVRLACPVSRTAACNNTAVIVVARRFLDLQRDGLKARTVTMAAGSANTPAGVTGPIVMRYNRVGKKIFRANRGRRVEAIMRIGGSDGRLLSERRIRLRIR